MKKEILEHIKRYSKDFDKISQRAELLARNKTFLFELQKINEYLGKEFHQLKTLPEKKLTIISKNNILFKLDYPKKTESEKDFWRINNKLREDFEDLTSTGPLDAWYIRYPGEKRTPFKDKLYEVIFHKFNIFNIFIDLWEKFCKKWHIDPKWDGNLDNFGKFQRALTEIIINTISNKDPLPIIIKVGPWTSKEDYEKLWKKVDLIQRKIFYKERESSIFARNICWYDLNKTFKMKPRQISELWNEIFPEDIDLLVIQRLKRNYKELKNEDEHELLEEIKTDPSLSDLKKEFEEEREIYVFGKIGRHKFYPDFADLIKHTIKNMEKRIKIFDTSQKLNIQCDTHEIIMGKKITP